MPPPFIYLIKMMLNFLCKAHKSLFLKLSFNSLTHKPIIMKKTLLSLTFIAMAFGAMSQGTWTPSGTEASIAAATYIDLGISNLKCQHSDAAGVVGKPDDGAPSVTYNGYTFANGTMMQGSTNGMYYAFLPAKDGKLDVAIKMGSNKKTYVYELKDAIYLTTVGNLTELTTDFAGIATITAEFFTTPRVYDTYTQKDSIWDGTQPFQTTGSNVYMIISIPVTANKTYVVSCAGSKLMLRGVNYIVGSAAIDQNKASSYEVYASAGRISIKNLNNEKVSVSDLMGRSIQVNNPSEIAVNPGMYFVKVNNEVTKIMVK